MASTGSNAKRLPAAAEVGGGQGLDAKADLRMAPELAPSNLISELESGLNYYVANLQNAINASLENRVIGILNFWFPHFERSPSDRSLKKIVNSAISPGQSGSDRTRDALTSLSGWDSNYLATQSRAQIKNLFREVFDSKVEVIEANGQICNSCSKQIKKSKYVFEAIDPGENAANRYWHVECLATLLVREQAKTYRSAKGGLDKQAIAVRGILGANKNNPSLKGKKSDLRSLGTSAKYEVWLSSLFKTWSGSTTVKEEFRSSYQSAFNEYAQAIAEYARTGGFPVQASKERLAKHFETSMVESVLERAIENDGYGRSAAPQSNKAFMHDKLEHLGASDENEEITPVITIDATRFSDARAVGEAFGRGNTVILNCTGMVEEEHKRIIDFASGLVFANSGTIERLAPKLFMLTPSGVHFSVEDKASKVGI